MSTILTVFLTTFTTLFALPFLILAAPILQHRITLRLATRRRACAAPTIRPSRDPIFGLDIGISDLLALKNNRRIKAWYASYQTYGKTFEFYAFGRRTVATIDARNVQFVLTTEAEKFGVGEFRRNASVPMMGSGVVNSDGEVWRKGRDLIMPVFARKNIADREMFAKHFDRALTRLKGDGATVDLKPLFDELVSNLV
jgi:cytochrome P450